MSLNPVTDKKKTTIHSIPSKTIYVNQTVEFAVFYKNRNNQFKKLLMPGQLFPDSIKRQLDEKRIDKLYIKGEDKLKYLLYLKQKEENKTLDNHPLAKEKSLKHRTPKAKPKIERPAVAEKPKPKLILEAVPVKKFTLDSVVTFPVFYKGKDQEMKKLLVSGNTFSDESQKCVTRYGLSELYIKKEDIELFKKYVQDNTPPFFLDPSLPINERSQLLYSHSTDILENLFNDPRCSWSYTRAKSLIEHAADVILEDHGAINAFADAGTVEYNTHTHSFDVAVFAMGFGHHLGLERHDIVRVGNVGMFHDIGKSQIDPTILNKEGPLDQDEFSVVKKHALYSNFILKSHVEQDKDILNGVKYHHERYDGSGYPDNLAGDAIPLFAQIVSLADVYDAVTSKKEYRDEQGSFETLSMMKNEMGHHFDKRLLMEFIRFMGPQCNNQ